MYQLGRSDYAVAPRNLGLGCAECGGTCGGLGVFDGGFDLSSWGLAEWGLVLLGAYAVGSMVFSTKRAVSSVRRLPGERRRRQAKAYRDKADEILRKGKARGGSRMSRPANF